MSYDGNRDLVFTDLNGVMPEFVESANILKDTYQLDTGDYTIGGYDSMRKDIGARVVGLKNKVNRLEWAKVLMLSHCLHIDDATTLPDTTSSGKPMPNFSDLPLMHNGDSEHDWQVDVMYSAAYYGLVNGTLQNNIEPGRFVTGAEAVKMVVRTGEYIKNAIAAQNDTLIPENFDRNAWYFEFYAKALTEDIFQSIIQNSTPQANVMRGRALHELLKTMLKRNMYIPESQAHVEGLL